MIIFEYNLIIIKIKLISTRGINMESFILNDEGVDINIL